MALLGLDTKVVDLAVEARGVTVLYLLRWGLYHDLLGWGLLDRCSNRMLLFFRFWQVYLLDRGHRLARLRRLALWLLALVLRLNLLLLRNSRLGFLLQLLVPSHILFIVIILLSSRFINSPLRDDHFVRFISMLNRILSHIFEQRIDSLLSLLCIDSTCVWRRVDLLLPLL